VFRRELLQRCSDFRRERERNFPESNMSGCCSCGIQQVHRAIQETFFLVRWYSRDTLSTTWVLISCCLVHFISRRARNDTVGLAINMQFTLVENKLRVCG
jgi:hypothetical protein